MSVDYYPANTNKNIPTLPSYPNAHKTSIFNKILISWDIEFRQTSAKNLKGTISPITLFTHYLSQYLLTA